MKRIKPTKRKTTPKKYDKYLKTGGILPPVRFWPSLETAQKLAKRVSRTVILEIKCDVSYPLPDHKPARWTPEIIRSYRLNNP